MDSARRSDGDSASDKVTSPSRFAVRSVETSPIGRRLQRRRLQRYDCYPKVPPRLARILGNNPLFFVTFCSHRRRKILATNSVNTAFLEFGSRAYAIRNVAVGRSCSRRRCEAWPSPIGRRLFLAIQACSRFAVRSVGRRPQGDRDSGATG
jgi:hypothetical protein